MNIFSIDGALRTPMNYVDHPTLIPSPPIGLNKLSRPQKASEWTISNEDEKTEREKAKIQKDKMKKGKKTLKKRQYTRIKSLPDEFHMNQYELR